MSASEFSFKVDDSQGADRRAFRAKVPGLLVKAPGHKESFEVLDLSAMGLAFRDKEKGFTEGEHIEFELHLNKKLFLSGVTAKVMRVLDNGLIGCNFENLDHRKEARLDKLVLEVQKRMIELKKKSRENR